MKIIGTGLTGLVGTRVVELLSPHHSFTNISLDTGYDITDEKSIEGVLGNATDIDYVFHFAAMTDVDGAESDRINGKDGKTWKVNVDATRNIAALCKKNGKRLLYISTDYVFDGKKHWYDEEDVPSPEGWYGITKYEGEKCLSELGSLGLIVRIANPYRSMWAGKADFVQKIYGRLTSGLPVKAPSDQIFVPTFIDDIAHAIDALTKQSASGIFHVVGSQALSPFAASQKIAKAFPCDESLVSPTTFAEFFAGRAPRPFQAYLKNDKIAKYGIMMCSFDEGLLRITKATKESV